MKIENLKIANDSIEEYHSKKSISASSLKYIAQTSVFHYINKKPIEQTKYMIRGNAVHTICYEGVEEFKKQYFVLPKLDLRKKDDKELKAKLFEKNVGKIALDEEEDTIIRGIYKNFNSSEKVKKWIKGKVEVSHYGTYQGIDVRVRPDCLGEDWISDIKTCQDASPEKFNREIENRKYHLQAYFYCLMLGIDPSRFRFIACETNHPFAVEVYKLDHVFIENAQADFERAFTFWKLYKEKGIITGYQSQDFDEDGTIILKGWKKRK
jgi:hypothetical protein